MDIHAVVAIVYIEGNIMNKNIVVIGGGFSGLAVSALLAKDGHSVTLLEKNSQLGGRARVLKDNGFTFDRGPSWYMMPEVFDRFFAKFGKKPSDYYQLKRLDPRYEVVYESGERLILSDSITENKQLFENIEKGAGKQLQLFLEKNKKLYELASELMYENVWDISTVFSKKFISGGLSLLRLQNVVQSWDKEVSKYFSDTRLKKILEFSSVFLAGSPYTTPSLYTMLSWADFGRGIWYPIGGFGKVVDALEKLSLEQGVTIKTNEEVTKIEVENNIRSVVTSKSQYSAEIVVAATDIPHVETKLLPKVYRSDSAVWEHKELGISALLMYLGFDKRLKNISHHTLYFSNDWEKNFDDIFVHKQLPRNPSLYISRASKTDITIVPKGGDQLVVLVPLGTRSYSERSLNEYSEKILDKLESIVGQDLRKQLVTKHLYTPRDFQYDYNAYKGTALGLTHRLSQSLWLRPKNKSDKVEGLYYTGQYTNPGVGVPTALVSADIVSQMIKKRWS